MVASGIRGLADAIIKFNVFNLVFIRFPRQNHVFFYISKCKKKPKFCYRFPSRKIKFFRIVFRIF